MMFGNRHLLYALTITIYFAICIGANLTGPIVRYRFSINLNINNIQIPYRIGLFSYEFDNNDLVVNRDENSSLLRLSIKKANIRFLEGKSLDDEYAEYDIPFSGVTIVSETEGTAQGSVDGKRVRNCRFVFKENKEAINPQVSDVVKIGIFNKLSYYIGRDLCAKIRL